MKSTKTASFFLERFGAATLGGAVELAAQYLRPPELSELGSAALKPVRLQPISEARHIAIGATLPTDGSQEGDLEAVASGFRARLRSSSSELRQRFTLAHEIAHTLFYHDDGTGLRHRFANLDSREHEAEEWICNRVASALLMPRKQLLDVFHGVETISSSDLLSQIDRTASQLAVSISALITRIGGLGVRLSDHFILILSFTPNISTGADAKLRVNQWASLSGKRDQHRIWPNNSAESIGLHSATTLYQKWQAALSADATYRNGRFIVDDGANVCRWNLHRHNTQVESIKVSTARNGRWQKTSIQCELANALYAHGSQETQRTMLFTALCPLSHK